MLGAPLAAMLEAIVYAGAIMVLFLFVIMMLNLGQNNREQERAWLRGSGWIVPAVLAAALLGQLLWVLGSVEATFRRAPVGVLEVGTRLFGPYVIAVELASILLLRDSSRPGTWRANCVRETNSGRDSNRTWPGAGGNPVLAGPDRRAHPGAISCLC